MKVQVIQGDITKMNVDGIVNAANTSLLGGGGVDGAIHKGGGKQILKECRAIRNRQGGCKVGEAVYTSGGNLKSRYVIHTVGPRWNSGKSNESNKLKNCYLNSLLIAENLNLKSIAFPNISTGIYGFPKYEAAQIALETVLHYKSDILKEVIFVCFDLENYDLYQKLLE